MVLESCFTELSFHTWEPYRSSLGQKRDKYLNFYFKVLLISKLTQSLIVFRFIFFQCCVYIHKIFVVIFPSDLPEAVTSLSTHNSSSSTTNTFLNKYLAFPVILHALNVPKHRNNTICQYIHYKFSNSK